MPQKANAEKYRKRKIAKRHKTHHSTLNPMSQRMKEKKNVGKKK